MASRHTEYVECSGQGISLYQRRSCKIRAGSVTPGGGRIPPFYQPTIQPPSFPKYPSACLIARSPCFQSISYRRMIPCTDTPGSNGVLICPLQPVAGSSIPFIKTTTAHQTSFMLLNTGACLLRQIQQPHLSDQSRSPLPIHRYSNH